MRGVVFNQAGSSFTLSSTGNQVILTLRLPGVNAIYMSQFNPQDQTHYLFKAALGQVEILTDEPAPNRSSEEFVE